MECPPEVRLEVENCAVAPLSVTVASVVLLSLKVTLPVGVPDPETTVAVNVTDCPRLDRFCDEPIVVLVAVSVGPQEGKWNEPIRVFQLEAEVTATYSVVYQNVQSSLGSVIIAE